MNESPTTVAPTLDTRVLVKQTADELLAEGIRPTVANVRSRTGRGSASTINAALKDWWQELSRRQAAQRNRPELPAPVLEAADRLWEAALLQAHEALSAYRLEAQRKVEEAQAVASAATEAQHVAEARVSTAERQLAMLEQVRLDLERRLAAERARREQTESRIQEIQAEAGQRLQEAQQRAVQLERMLGLEQERYTSLERRLVAAVDEEKLARQQAEHTVKDQAATWRAEEGELHRQLQTLHEQIARLQGQKGALEDQLNARNLQIQTLQQEKETMQEAAVSLREQLTSSLRTQETLRTAIAKSETLLNQANQEKTALLEKLRAMEMKFAALEGECQSLHGLLGKISS